MIQAATSIPALQDVPLERIDPRFVRSVPIHFARQHAVIGLRNEEANVMDVATDDVRKSRVIANIARLLRVETHPVLAPAERIQRAINHAYGQQPSDVDRVLDSIEAPDINVDAIQSDADLLDNATRAPVIKLVNLILFEAVNRRASDVHIQPLADHLAVRLRIDGVLFEFLRPARQLADEIVSRIKVMGGMDIAEKRLAQDGRTTVRIGDRIIDLRIASLPTAYGERVVLRLLDKGARLYELAELGMPEDVLARFEQVVHRSHGIILVTGPTGSGKTTTLYAALQRIDYTRLNVVTIEDPIEYFLTGISQTQVTDRKGMSFANSLRSVLRQDPDVIMVGEIRDEPTARMAIQSSLTGHLVLSTLHTNDTVGSIARLFDLGIESYLVADSLLAVLAQRLVRCICAECKVPETLDSTTAARLGAPQSAGQTVWSGKGCDRCSGTGYFERRALFELLLNDGEACNLIHDRARAGQIRRAAQAAGMRTLREEGVRQVLAGMTTAAEVLRVTQGAFEAEG